MSDERIEKLESEVAELKEVLQESRDHWRETHDMISAINEKLMKPQPGHEKGLLDRMASATMDLEKGKWGVKFVLWALGVFAAVGGAVLTWEKLNQ